MGSFFIPFQQNARQVMLFEEVTQALRPGLSPNLVLKHAGTD